MEIIEMFIDEQDNESGLEAVSVVEHPAIELDFIALKKENEVQLAEVSKERRILMGVALVPNKPIYRKDGDREFYIYFSKETLVIALKRFFKNKFQSNVTEEHQKKVDGCYIYEAWIKEDDTHDKSVKYGLSAPIGSIIVTMAVDNDDIYQKAKDGTLKGFSIEGYFTDTIKMSKDEDELLIEQIKEVLNSNL